MCAANVDCNDFPSIKTRNISAQFYSLPPAVLHGGGGPAAEVCDEKSAVEYYSLYSIVIISIREFLIKPKAQKRKHTRGIPPMVVNLARWPGQPARPISKACNSKSTDHVTGEQTSSQSERQVEGLILCQETNEVEKEAKVLWYILQAVIECVEEREGARDVHKTGKMHQSKNDVRNQVNVCTVVSGN